MKKLKLSEGWGPAPTNAKTSATKLTQPAVDFPSTISDPLDIASVKARAMKLAPAETEADLIKKWSKPEEEEDDIDPVGKATGYLKSAIDLISEYPWLLVFLWKPARGFLWNIGKSSFKKMFPGNVDIASVEKQIFVASNKLQAAFKTGKFKRNMGYLNRAFLEKGIFTPQQYKEFQAEITNGRLNRSFWRTNSELRKSFKDFAIMCMHTNKISFKQFKQLASFNPNSAELKALVQAKVDLAKKMGINNLSLSPEEKRILNPTNISTKSKKSKTNIRGGRRF
jgi:hypothetical protein